METARGRGEGGHGTSDADAAALEPIAIGAALEAAPDGVARAMTRYRYCLDPDEGAAAALRRQERAGLSFSRTYDGMIAMRGLFDEVTGAAIVTAVEARSAPTAHDTRTPGSAAATRSAISAAKPSTSGSSRRSG